ncbi:NAD(P)H-hydrate dehydratase [Candidatus Fermentibacteria bacterium]|nr:NAD(P)H-hydrate dehydratase [Candidatus Fermentibacteria bacterium]
MPGTRHHRKETGMSYWVTPEEMAGYDRQTIARGTPGDVLMERAGSFAARIAIRMLDPSAGYVEVWVGPGNNGGDGLVLARHMEMSGYDVRVVLAVENESKISENCLRNLNRFVEAGGDTIGSSRIEELEETPPALCVDALLGTGFHGRLKGRIAACVEVLRQRNCPVLAIDTPTGVSGETGEADPMTPGASVTVTFAAPKIGLLLPPGCGYAGAVIVAPIGITVPGSPDRAVLDVSAASELLPSRPASSHKGTFGKVLLLGGSEMMPGAPQLMTLGALRTGVGLVTLYVPYPVSPSVSGNIPEALSHYFIPGDVTSLPDPTPYDAAAVGPGLGNSDETWRVVRHVLGNWNLPLVLDADALNVLSGKTEMVKQYQAPILLTPHPGELGRLCEDDSVTGMEPRERWQVARRLANSVGASVLLKGRPTVVISPRGAMTLIPTGNPGLATGGSGDVLTGMAGSFLAQGLSAEKAGVISAFLHGLSADILATETSERAILPSDVAATMGRTLMFVETTREQNLLRLEGSWNDRLWNIP